jgi:hypothetical protein
MLTELYIEALLTDDALADEVWALWDQRRISDELAGWLISRAAGWRAPRN